MRSMSANPGCGCCLTLRAYIQDHLDPFGLLTPRDNPVEVVASLDRAFRSEGGSGVTVEEMAAYLDELRGARS